MEIAKAYQNLHYATVKLTEHSRKDEDGNYIIDGKALRIIVKKLSEAEKILKAWQSNKPLNAELPTLHFI